jgi:PAS domain S-box-containing protein
MSGDDILLFSTLVPAGEPPGRLLVVDDEGELLKALEEILSAQGYEVSTFTSGVKALAELREKDFDILLTDLMMPGMGGIELFQQAVEIDPHIIGIVMTGQATIQTAIEAMKVGVFDYLLKPFTVHSFLPLLNRALAARKLRMENLQLRHTLAIYELGQTISYTLALNTILDKVADGALQQCYADEASVMLPAPGGRELYIAAVRGRNRASLLGQRVPIDQHVAGWVAAHKEPLMFRGQVNDPRCLPLSPRRDIEMSASLPLLIGGRLMGILNLNFTHPRRQLTLGELKALSILCGIAASALESARLHEEVLAAERKYRGIFESTNEGIFQASRDAKRFITANPAMARILEYDSPQELIGAISDMGTQVFAEADRRDEIFRRLKDDGGISDCECELLRKDGSRIWGLINVSRARENPEGVGFEGSVIDITRRKRAEDSLNRERQLLATIIDNIPDPIYVKDLESRFLAANQSVCRFMGAGSPANLVGKTDYDFYPRDVADPFVADEKRIHQTGTPVVNQEERIRDVDGRETWFYVTKVPFRDEDGSIRGIVGINRDVTEIREAHQENRVLARFPRESPNPILRADQEGVLLYANAASRPILENWGCGVGQRIPEEYRALALQALASADPVEIEMQCGDRAYLVIFAPIPETEEVNIYSQDITERRNLERQILQTQKIDAIGRLAGGIAHDFNNILTAIIGYADFLRKRAGTRSPLLREIAEIKKAGERAASLTQQLLAFSRKQILQSKVVDLNSVIDGMEKMLKRLIPENVSIDLILEPALGLVRADVTQMEQVLLNLVVNASDAMPEGGKLLIETSNVILHDDYARAHISAKPGPHVLLAVSDTGSGMDDETRRRLFEPFFTTKKPGEGTGLGLSVVYGIVKQSGGNIWVYSEPGKGTAFKIYLPRVFESAETALEKKPEQEPVRGSETILVVEDEEMIRQILAVSLEEAGYRVLSAADGEEAVRISGEHGGTIDLLITDVVLPKRSGKETADRIMSLRPNLEVLYMSGYTGNAIVHHGVLDRGIAFLQKPFSPSALLQKVREVLDAAKPKAQ